MRVMKRDTHKYKKVNTDEESNTETPEDLAPASDSNTSICPRRSLILFIIYICFLVMIVFFSTNKNDIGKKISWKNKSNSSSQDDDDESFLLETPSVAQKQSIEVKNFNVDELLKKLETSLIDISLAIQENYGSYLDELLIFSISVDTNKIQPKLFQRLFPVSSNAKNRLKRRLQIKVLESNLYPDNKNPTTFIWQTGGHSAAAAHGNLFNESYTAEMERTLQPAFSSLGINFHAYNYAMAGMSSNPELAVCQESVYGPNIDVLSWDFGMTDGKSKVGITLWGSRAALHPSRPILFGFTGDNNQRVEGFLDLEEQANLSSIVYLTKPLDELYSTFPDTAEQKDIDSIPYAIRYYLCSGKVENGEPCGNKKYDVAKYCPVKINGQVGWHPGWKNHMLNGKLISIFLLHELYAAVTSLKKETVNQNALLKSLLEEENIEKEQYLQYAQNLDSNSDDIPNDYGKIAKKHQQGINQVLFFKRSICRTGLLPSHTRYYNIAFNSMADTDFFQQGILRNQYESLESSDIPLIHIDNANSNNQCVEMLDRDYKDYFLVGLNENGKTFSVPNESELANYNTYSKDYTITKAAIMIVLYKCPWHKCPKDYITIEDLNKKEDSFVKFNVNGDVVNEVEKVDNDSFFLKNSDGGVEWDFDGKQPIKLSFQVSREGSFFYITSMILFYW